MAKTKEQLPKILTANDLLTGATVYYTSAGTWSSHAFAANLVIDQAIVDIDAGGEIRPARLREMIRATGPTVRLDLNKSISPIK